MAAPLIVTPAAVVGTGTALGTLVDELADQLGLFLPTVVSGLVASGDTTRYVLADAFEDADNTPGGWGPSYLYVVDGVCAGTQSRVQGDGDLGHIAGVRLARALPAALEVNTSLKITSPFPVKRYRNVKGLNQCIDEANGRIPVQVRLPLTGNGTRSYDLAAYDYLSDDLQAFGIYDQRLTRSSGVLELSGAPFRFVRDGASFSLITEVTYATSETFELALLVRADRLIYDGSAWQFVAYANRGLRDHDAYQTAADPKWVLAAAMVKALEAWRKLATLGGREQDRRAVDVRDITERLRHWVGVEAAIRRALTPVRRQSREVPFGLPAGWYDPAWVGGI